MYEPSSDTDYKKDDPTTFFLGKLFKPPEFRCLAFDHPTHPDQKDFPMQHLRDTPWAPQHEKLRISSIISSNDTLPVHRRHVTCIPLSKNIPTQLRFYNFTQNEFGHELLWAECSDDHRIQCGATVYSDLFGFGMVVVTGGIQRNTVAVRILAIGARKGFIIDCRMDWEQVLTIDNPLTRLECQRLGITKPQPTGRYRNGLHIPITKMTRLKGRNALQKKKGLSTITRPFIQVVIPYILEDRKRLMTLWEARSIKHCLHIDTTENGTTDMIADSNIPNTLLSKEISS